MSTKLLQGKWILCMVLSLGLLLAGAARAAPAERPNIILIIADDKC